MAVAGFSVDTAANWASNNPTLNLDELAFDTTNRVYKLGDGSTAYNSLPEGGRAAMKGRDPLPTTTFPGAFAETFPRDYPSISGVAMTSGTPRLAGIVLYAGEVVSGIGFGCGAALSGATHQWAALTDSAGTVLAVSADGTSGAWAVSTAKNYAMASPYTVTSTGLYYLALCIVASTVPNVFQETANSVLVNTMTPAKAYTAASNVGAPPSVGGSLGTLTASTNVNYAVVS